MIPEKKRIMYKKNDRFRRTVCLLLAVILWIPLLSSGGGKAEAASGWSMIDGGGLNGLNVSSNNRAENAAMAEWNGEVYLAWQEKVASGPAASQIRVKKYTSTGWTSVDGNGPNGINMNTGKSGTRPTMAVFNGALYVAWVEEVTSSPGQIRIKKYIGNSSWTSAEGSSTSINFNVTNNANFPALVAYNNALYATWVEAGKVYVRKYDGTEWTSVDGGANGLNADPATIAAFPVIAVLGNELVAVWSEVQGSIYQLRAKKYNGTSWTTIDGGTTGLNMVNGKSATSPSVIVVDGALYAAWVEPADSTTDDQIRVKKYDGNAWTSIDGNGKYGINVNAGYRAYQVKLAAVNHEVYAVWSEFTGSGTIFKIRAKKYNGSTWTSAEDGRNGWIVDATKAAFYPAVAVLNNDLYVAWQEKNSTAEQIRAALLPPPAVNSITVTPNPVSLAQGGSKQLQATVDASGGADPTVTWTSSDSSNKVAVSSTGNVTVAVDAAPGNYTITATSAFNNSKVGTVTITVMLPTVNSVLVSPLKANITQGGSRQFNAAVDVVEGTEKTVNWTSSDAANKVAVDSTGNVTVAADAAPGTYTITVTSTVDNSKKATTTITVLAAPAINSVTVTPGTSSVAQGGSKQLAASVDAVGGAATTVTWTSSDVNNKVAVNSSGNVTVAADAALGDYTITATSTVNNGKKGTATITVTAALAKETTPAAEIDYAAEQLTGLAPNGTYTINGTAVTADGSGKVNIAGSWLGATVNVVKLGNGTTTADSTAQSLTLPARPATPSAGKTDETSINGNDGTLTNVTSAMEYKKGTSGSWTDVTGTSLTDLPPGTYDIRVKATSSAFASLAQTVTIAAFNASRETTPVAEIDYAAERLTGLAPNGSYTINGTAVTADGTGKVNIAGSWLGATVNVVKLGNGTTTADSTAQSLTLPARPATPSAGKTDETSINGNDGTLTNVTSAMEYKKGTAGSWTDVTGTSLTDLPPGTYDIRVKATSSAFASEAQQLTISAFGLSPEPKPAAGVDYAAEQLTGLAPNGAYIINGTAVTADSSGKVNIAGSWLGATVNVVKKGNDTTTTDSAAQTLSLPARLAAPVDISVTDITYNGANDGSILHVNLTMEFKKGNTGTWTNTTGTSVVGLAPGIYYVRVAATESDFASIPAQVTIHDSDATLPAAPSVSADDVNNVIVGLDTTMEFSIDGGAYVRYNGTNMPQLISDHRVHVRVAASGSVPAGPSATLIFTTNVSVPAGGLTVTADPKEESVDVLINGKVENAGKATTTESGGVKTTTVAVDSAKLQAKLDAEGVNAVVTIPVKSASNVIVGELNGKMIKNMENLSATLVLQTDKGTYTLPAKEINIDELAGKLGSSVKLEDIQLKVTVAQTPDTMAKVVEKAASKGEFSVVAPALDFTVTGTYGGKTVEVTAFNVYVERIVALPDGIDPNKITTGVVIEPNGTVRHVPTKINLIEGKYYAQINSLTNSTYAVVWHPLEFSDAANHWAKDAVNDMGSRMVIEGTGNGTFSPDRDITRAEFAAIIVRGLGLKLENEATPFADVNVSAWYNSAVHTAYAYHLISGFEDGTFRPNDKITREQAMTIIAKAMTITSLNAKLPEQSADVTLRPYADAAEVSAWAQGGVADNIQSGIVTGRSGMKISPKAFITRAEVAVIVERLLRKSDLI